MIPLHRARSGSTLGAPGPSLLGTRESNTAISRANKTCCLPNAPHANCKRAFAACNTCNNYIALLALALLALTATACRPKPFPSFPANYREYAYVTNSGSNTVSVYDIVNVRLDREIIVGEHPVAVAASPTRNEVYVVNSGSGYSNGSLSVLDATKNAVVATIPLRRAPVALTVSARGRFAWVANSASNSVSLIDLIDRREIAILPVGQQPADLRLSPDGLTLAVANRVSGSITLIDPAARTIRATLSGCPGASDLVILPDSSKLFAACSTGHQVMSIALAGPPHPTPTQPNPAHPGRPDRIEALLDVGRAPVQLALKPDGGELFALNSLSDTISEVVTTTNDVGGAYLIGDTPVRGIVSADNATLWVANLHSQVVNLYSIDDGKLSGYVHVGDGPSALAFASNGYLLLVVDSASNDLAVVRTATRSLFTVLPAGKNPSAIAVKSFTA
jgi:YVTN family beta-propeller protein